MQPCHRRDKAQAKPAAGLRAAFLEPHKPPQDPLPLGRGHPGAAIGHDDLGVISVDLCAHRHLRRVTIAALRGWRTVFQRVVDEVRDGLPKELAVTANL